MARAQTPWTAVTPVTTQDLWSVCYGQSNRQNVFVAVGTGGTILTSPDGAEWTAQSSGTNVWLVAVNYCDGLYIAVGDQGTILTSPDAVNWTLQVQGGARLNAVAQVPGSDWIIAVGQDGAALTSNDGVHWSTENLGTTDWVHGLYVTADAPYSVTAVGQAGTVVTSTSGSQFTVTNAGTANDLQGTDLIGFPAGVATFIVGNEGYLATDDPAPWVQLPTPVTANLNAIVQSPNITGGAPTQVVIVGDGGTTIAATSPASSYALDWVVIPPATTNNLLGVCATSSLVVAVGQAGTILTSAPGLGVPQIMASVAPANSISIGSSTTLSAAVAGTGPFAYQWSFNGQAIAGATSSSYLLSNAQVSQSGTYTVKVSNAYSSTSRSAQLSVTYVATMPGLIDENFAPAGANSGLGPDAALPNGDVLVNDTWISANGSVNANFSPSADVAASAGGAGYCIIQADGRIVLVGTTLGIGFVYPHSQRFNADGSTDATWSPTLTSGEVRDQADPSVALPNDEFLSVVNGNQILRLTADGSIDPTYAAVAETSSGLKPTTILTYDEIAGGAISATDAVAGWVWFADSSNSMVYRVLTDGTPDPSFSAAAVATSIQAMHAQGRQLFYCGSAASGSPATFSAGRLNSNGSGDESYAAISIPAAWVKAFAYGPDGSLYVDYSEGLPDPYQSDAPFTTEAWWQASQAYPAPSVFKGTYREGIVRFDPNGNFDPAFELNLDGGWPDASATADAQIQWMGFAPDGQLYVAGTFQAIQGESRNGVARLNLSAAGQTAVLANMSTRGTAGDGSHPLTGGFVIGNAGTKSMLLRGVGPALSSFGVTDPLPDPVLALYNGSGQIQLVQANPYEAPQPTDVVAAESAVGAFAFPSGSQDVAVLQSLGDGSDTFTVTSASGGASGAALVELYDADTPPLAYSSPQLINVSGQANVTPNNPLVGGFIIAQGNTKRVLIRAIGPGLAQFGVANTLPDPVLALYSGQTEIATEQGWSAWQSLLEPTFSAVGAFSLTANSNDSALVISLPPGQYTAQLTSASGASGAALVEIYAVP